MEGRVWAGPPRGACIWPPKEGTRRPTHLFSCECRAASCRVASSSSLTSWFLLLLNFNLRERRHEEGAPRDPDSVSGKRNHRHVLVKMYRHTRTHKKFLEAFYYDVWGAMASTYNRIIIAIFITHDIPGAVLGNLGHCLHSCVQQPYPGSMVFTTSHMRKLRVLELNNLLKARELVAELRFHPTIPPSFSLSFLLSFLPPIHPSTNIY